MTRSVWRVSGLQGRPTASTPRATPSSCTWGSGHERHRDIARRSLALPRRQHGRRARPSHRRKRRGRRRKGRTVRPCEPGRSRRARRRRGRRCVGGGLRRRYVTRFTATGELRPSTTCTGASRDEPLFAGPERRDLVVVRPTTPNTRIGAARSSAFPPTKSGPPGSPRLWQAYLARRDEVRRLDEVEMLELEVLPEWDAPPPASWRQVRADMVPPVLGLDVEYGRQGRLRRRPLRKARRSRRGLMGHNGCGNVRSTLNAIFGLVAPDCGEVLVNGAPLRAGHGAAAAAGSVWVPASATCSTICRCART